ncbi:MAG: tRNA uridine-5-carboxymethylaminomethyl(34) synthesis GTPase MnmE [Cyanobacteria bacterium]|nr:tRNA uridine-5-carboxymethylaminomethyl(34) synthesis GTPase MnmE [Cyanobacteriota bacterium]MDA1020406.1 tRNA uridine-5-carboxymethylaminomethyl(34) synthesis GTPase MnmE [Cyanobacteriota bacterium]
MSTIAAIVTAPGNAAVSIIRISGSESWPIVRSLRRSAPQDDEAGKFQLSWLYDGDQKIEQALILPFKAPRSYTGEDVIEIQCHGGYWLSQKILRLILEAGAVLAKPGEFTERAVMNGKIDLSQAESIMDLIEARSDRAGVNAIKLYQGDLGSEIKTIRTDLLNTLGALTASIDFPDEVEDYDKAKYQKQMAKTIAEIEKILESEQEGHVLREGYKVAIVGQPNAGKSTLLNALLKKERAIVTEIAGTTRDLIEENYSIKGLPIVLLDTAGIRESSDQVERIGIERSQQAIKEADLTLVLADMTQTHHQRWQLEANCLHIGTKLDLVDCPDANYDLMISAHNSTNIEELKELIYSRVMDISSESQVKINHRQADLLRKAKDALIKSQAATELAIDFWTIDLRGAIAALGEITGETLTEELLDNIFSRFCIGK